MLSNFAQFRNCTEALSEAIPKNFRVLMTATASIILPDSRLTSITLNVLIASDM